MTERIELYTPSYEDLWFRQRLLADAATMSYNHAWGGTIDFPESRWKDWFNYWMEAPAGKRFYRYLRDIAANCFVGEIAYHYDGERSLFIADIIVAAEHRSKGYGTAGLALLCGAAKQNGIQLLYDDIAIDNPAISLFLRVGFREEYRTDQIVMLKKEL